MQALQEPVKEKSPLLRLFGCRQNRPPLFWAERDRCEQQRPRLQEEELLGCLLELGRRALLQNLRELCILPRQQDHCVLGPRQWRNLGLAQDNEGLPLLLETLLRMELEQWEWTRL